jgi:3',5'-cyclic-nucleotide phosphodiesterase
MLTGDRLVYLCSSRASFASKLSELSDRSGSDCAPIFAFFGIDFSNDETNLARRKASRNSWGDSVPPSPGAIQRTFTFSSQSDEAPGLSLLTGVSSDIQVQDGPNLVVPIAILRETGSSATDSTNEPPNNLTLEHKQIARCLDAGAFDVLTTPLDRGRLQGLLVHAYRAHRSAQKEMSRFLARKKLRKLSWVGVNDEQPYAYLREAMVSKLMKGICNPEEEIVDEFQEHELNINPDRHSFIREQVGSWKFSAHEFSEDELVYAACQMLQHAFTLPGLEQWQLTSGELQTFLLACRAAYNSFVLYHNFRHAIDVLQSVFCFLLHIGALPPFEPIGQAPVSKSPIASLLSPFDAMTLLISAIGHDVGHPGVNNFFLVKLNAPLAQLYNDNSVLEAFHCAAFSQILRRHWPVAFKDKQLRKLLISSILATDMGVHQKFMERMGQLQERFHENHKSVDGWKPQDVELYKTLLCGLLIKCADISNVARPWMIAEKWTQILQEEFANQGEMEKEVGMETALFGGPPELGNIYKLATSQIGFMSIFALPLFEGISDLLPQLQFTAEHIRRNQAQWKQHANDELRKQGLPIEHRSEITISPRSQSPAPPVDSDDTEKAPDGDREGSLNDPLSPNSNISTDSESGAYNENNIEPVVSPDTPGPQIEITGTPLVPEVQSSRKSSSAMPDFSYFSIPGAPESARGSVATQLQTPLADSNRPPGDPAVLAAVLYANSATNGGTFPATTEEPVPESEDASERPSSSRHAPSQGSQRHHAHHSSSVRTSAPSTSNRNSCTRTQSVSTYSNNMTPISPATNASSFLAVDSGDEKRITDDSAPQSEIGGPDDTSTRPSTSYASVGGDQESTYSRGPGSIMDVNHSKSEDGHGNAKEYTPAANGTRSPTQSTTTGESVKNESLQGDDSRNGGLRRIPKKRSRLRLAFWKRRNHHHQEVHGES